VPTVLRFDGLRAAIYFNDHRPAHVHVHVTGDGNSAVIDLHCPHGPPRVRECYGFKYSELRRIEAAVAGALEGLCRRWEEIHGYS
jgi:Domain of unknown function (DUF4160)